MKSVCKICNAWMLKHREYNGYLKCHSCGYMRKEYIVPIAKSELLMGRDKQYPGEYTQEISDNLDQLLIPMNQIRAAYNKPMIVSSGWRPPEINANTPGAAPQSKHMIGLAVDIVDIDGSLRIWLLQNLQLLKDLNIYLENFNWTPRWCHLQLGGPGSGKRIFVPNLEPASQHVWDNSYDSSFDT